jgi:hypothetical protein
MSGVGVGVIVDSGVSTDGGISGCGKILDFGCIQWKSWFFF